ncbi:DUF805 domain-containing protein [Rhizobium sp. BK602]|uniref:DUF805 domain-containing protein n=1 Tax=Rhizobium sp. BK602 TaxID=2586986 RepID=UPI00161755A7|nr:DUF805 domain-containing protein [Rhizobium sp. BK602]MBB3607194.1 uncharacterized membrane protein YhaH (DUF805 family) [Rhizobium sp. BK602]
MTSLFLNDRLNRPTYWMFISILLGFWIGAVVLSKMGYAPDLLRYTNLALFFVASVMGARLRDFGWSAFWGWAGVAAFSFTIPIGIMVMREPTILSGGEISGVAGRYILLLSTLPFWALIVAVGLPASDPNSKYGRSSRYNITVSESTQQFALRWTSWTFAIFRRRVNRSVYWVGVSTVFAILFARVAAERGSNDEVLDTLRLFLLVIVIVAKLVAARLRDFGWPGSWGWGAVCGLNFVVQGIMFSFIEDNQMDALLTYVRSGPILLCLAIIVGVGIPRGNPGINKFGPPFHWRRSKVAA